MWIVKYRVNGKAPLYAKSYDTNDKGQAEMMFWGDWYGNRLEVSPDDGFAKIECVVKSNENQKRRNSAWSLTPRRWRRRRRRRSRGAWKPR